VADEEVIEVLQSSELFSGLSSKQLHQVVQAGKELRFQPGQELTSQGQEDGARYFLVLEGTATVRAGGREVGSLSRGDGIGEIALMDGGPRSATVVAETPLRTFSLAVWNFRPLLKDPAIAESAVALLCRRLRSAEARSADDTGGS